jgi:hypothetical protein
MPKGHIPAVARAECDDTSMWPFRRRAATAPAPGTAEHFHAEVTACMDALNRRLPRLTSRYSVPAVAAALTMQTVAALSVCVRDGRMTREEARQVVLRIGALEFSEADFVDSNE